MDKDLTLLSSSQKNKKKKKIKRKKAGDELKCSSCKLIWWITTVNMVFCFEPRLELSWSMLNNTNMAKILYIQN